MPTPAEFEAQREKMVIEQIIRRGIQDQRVLKALRTIPRHEYIPAENRAWAYTDGALPIRLGQTISQPYIVALMSATLELKGSEKVLEVGTGSGYQAAILSQLAAEIHTIERHIPLAEAAQKIFQQQALTNIYVHTGDGSLGLSDQAPFDAIMVTAAAPKVPQLLLEQLTDGGRMVLPVGKHKNQWLEIWHRQGVKFTKKMISAVAFVPLIGAQGWHEREWEACQ